MTRLLVFAFSLPFLACGSSEPPMTPERELAKIAWELVAPLDSSIECKKIGDALVNPKGPRMAVNVHDERVEKVVKMFPEMKLGFEMR